MDTLRQFNGDKHTKDALFEYLVAYFDEQILDRAYKGHDVTSVATATNELKKAFDQLEIDYGIKEKKATPTNTAS